MSLQKSWQRSHLMLLPCADTARDGSVWTKKGTSPDMESASISNLDLWMP